MAVKFRTKAQRDAYIASIKAPPAVVPSGQPTRGDIARGQVRLKKTQDPR